MTIARYDTLDAALDTLSGYGSELGNGNFNHAPMVAEALCALGRPAMVMPWIERYRERMLPRATPGEPIRADAWREALGRRERFADWSRFFREALAAAPWRAVLERWVGCLAPGFSAAATHGPIRVGHAVRGLTDSETPQRRGELADALASWAASYSELPPDNGGGNGRLPPREALAQVAIVPAERRRPGNIAAALARLGEFPDFAASIGAVDLGGNIDARLEELCELFARVALAHIRNIPTAIAFVHGVTGLVALGHIVPHVGEASARSLLRYAWQAGCGLYACFADGSGLAPEGAGGEDAAVLVERALANGDEHVIKFAEACLWRYRLAPSPAYPAAVAHVIATISAR
ncbi:MAG TPA: questin oxidase family protein [Stellaceae bacterium]|nr:questin oxidase family protein [Stellaceae bacterium]